MLCTWKWQGILAACEEYVEADKDAKFGYVVHGHRK